MRAVATVILVTVLGAGCASSTHHASAGVAVECVVERFEPNASVIYSFEFCAQLAETSISYVRVLRPVALKGRVYAIDLGTASDRKKGEYSEFEAVGTKLKLRFTDDQLRSKSEGLIPVSLLEEEPNQSSQRNAMARPFSVFKSRSSRG